MRTKQKRTKAVVSVLVLAGLVVFALTAIGGNLEPSGPPGPTMKTLDEVEPRIAISSLPYTISVSGSYYLTGDVQVDPCAPTDGITVEVNDVTIDLAGFSLIGAGGPPFGIYMNARSNVEIRNGTVRNFGHGIYAANNGKEHRIIDVRVVSNMAQGIWLFGNGYLVKDCTTAENGGAGIRVEDGCTVTGNTVYKNQQNGINVGAGCTVTANTAYGNEGHGIHAGTGCTIIGNTARLNTGNGIDFDGLGTIADNTADRNGGHGISVNSGAVVARNSCSENTLDGIKASSGNHIVGNDCGGNGFGGDGAGIHVVSLRNVIEGNTVLLNDRGIDVDSTRNFIAKNMATMNTTDYDIVGNNAYGPIVDVASVGDISGTANADHPWANFEF